MNDLELDSIVGGSYTQCIELADAANLSKSFGSDYFLNAPKGILGRIAFAFGCNPSDVRVVIKTSCDGENEYYINNKKISHSEVIKKLSAKYCNQ